MVKCPPQQSVVKSGKNNKYRNEDLPRGCQDENQWRKHFIPTFLWYVAWQRDPWAMDEADTTLALQQIWDQLYGGLIPYTVKAHDAVYAIAMQRVCDSWRNVYGSSAISIIVAFFNSTQSLNSDDSRRDFATSLLESSKFLYSNSSGDDPKNYKGLLRGPFIIQTLSAHFTAIRGAIEVTSMGDPRGADKHPCGALGLAAAAVERALTLFSTGTVTLAKFTAGTKGVMLPKTLMTKSGQSSDKSTSFNEGMWGCVTRARISQARTVLRNSSLEKILQKARDFEKISSRGSKTSSTTETKDINDADENHAQLQDLSDPEWN